jgi:flavodoxin I
VQKTLDLDLLYSRFISHFGRICIIPACLIVFIFFKFMKILVGYGTLSGNTQVVAESITQYLKTTKNHDVEIKPHDEIQPDELTQYDFVILGGSTWDEGSANPATQTFFENMEGSTVNLTGRKFGVFGLGETNYAHFCAVADRLAEAIKSKGGEIVGELHKIDGYPDDNILADTIKWLDGVIGV